MGGKALGLLLRLASICTYHFGPLDSSGCAFLVPLPVVLITFREGCILRPWEGDGSHEVASYWLITCPAVMMSTILLCTTCNILRMFNVVN